MFLGLYALPKLWECGKEAWTGAAAVADSPKTDWRHVMDRPPPLNSCYPCSLSSPISLQTQTVALYVPLNNSARSERNISGLAEFL